MQWIGSIDRISGDKAYIILNDGERELVLPASCLPEDAGEGMAYTITIERNEEEEERLRQEIAELRQDLQIE